MESKATKPISAEMFPGPGFRVKAEFHRLDSDFMEQFTEFATPDISDMLNRLYAMDSAVACLTGKHHRLCGPACTVKVFPGDNLMVHKSLDVAMPGDIVVIDAHASSMNAVLGDIISTKARHRGIAGFVVDGYVRDLDGIRDLNLPVYAKGETLIGPLHRGPGEINYPICCGGVVVSPGDIIVADTGGIVVIPQRHIEEVHTRLKQHKERTTTYLASVKKGEFSNAWVDRQLDNAFCRIEG